MKEGLKPAAVAVVRKPDGRYWLVARSNAFGGHAATFPKGKHDGMSLQACALNEIFEKTGLQIRLTQHLIDSKRSGSYTRYYLAERIGGNQAGMRHVLGKSGCDAGACVTAAKAADQLS